MHNYFCLFVSCDLDYLRFWFVKHWTIVHPISYFLYWVILTMIVMWEAVETNDNSENLLKRKKNKNLGKSPCFPFFPLIFNNIREKIKINLE